MSEAFRHPETPITISVMDRKVAVTISEIGLILTTLGNLLVQGSRPDNQAEYGNAATGLERAAARLHDRDIGGLGIREEALVKLTLERAAQAVRRQYDSSTSSPAWNLALEHAEKAVKAVRLESIHLRGTET